jgi:ectoine hydroxylase-related dioxygenase (phytanoyl-CoA dioxygenase family)
VIQQYAERTVIYHTKCQLLLVLIGICGRYGNLSPETAVTTILALEDVTVESGAIRVVPGSNLKGQLPSDWSPLVEGRTRSVVIDIDVQDGVPVPMRAGQILFLHCHTLHGSEGNHSSTDRRMLFCRYADADAVEVYNAGAVRVSRLLSGVSSYESVRRAQDDEQ